MLWWLWSVVTSHSSRAPVVSVSSCVQTRGVSSNSDFTTLHHNLQSVLSWSLHSDHLSSSLLSTCCSYSAQWNYLTTTSDQQVFTMNQLQAVVTSFLWCATKLTSAQFGQPTNANPFVDQVNIVELLLKMFKYFCCHLHHSFIHSLMWTRPVWRSYLVSLTCYFLDVVRGDRCQQRDLVCEWRAVCAGGGPLHLQTRVRAPGVTGEYWTSVIAKVKPSKF